MTTTTKNRNRQLRDLLDELNQRADEVDDTIRPDDPVDDYGIGELSAMTVVKLTLAKVTAILDALDESRGTEMHKKVAAVACGEVAHLLTQMGEDPEAADEKKGDALDTALANFDGPVI